MRRALTSELLGVEGEGERLPDDRRRALEECRKRIEKHEIHAALETCVRPPPLFARHGGYGP